MLFCICAKLPSQLDLPKIFGLLVESNWHIFPKHSPLTLYMLYALDHGCYGHA